MAAPRPVVRQFIPCSEVRCDTTVSPNRYTVDDPFYAIAPPERGYPFRVAELWLFCQLTDATGAHELSVDLTWDADAEVIVLHRFRVELGADRLGVRNYAVRLKKVPFARAGFYELRLREGTEVLARAVVRLEELR
jgi:hypothetical protein